MNQRLDKEINKELDDEDEITLEFARGFKKKLRFDIGDIVYLKSDTQKKNPLTIYKFLLFEDDDYLLCYTTAQKDIKSVSFIDKVLTK